MKKTGIVVVLTTAIACAWPALAQFSRPQSAVDYRQAAFTVMNNQLGRIYQVAQGKVAYDKEAVIRAAEVVEFMGKLPFEAFTPGSDLMESKAKPSIWKEEAKFKQLAADMQAETVKLTAAAKTGNLETIRTQLRATIKSCDNCHDSYRER